MQIEDAVDGAGSVAGVADLGPLAWVLDELRKSLEVANKSLKRYVRDAEAARGTDLASVDASQLRMARQHMHQAVGALEMVGLLAPAHMLRATPQCGLRSSGSESRGPARRVHSNRWRIFVGLQAGARDMNDQGDGWLLERDGKVWTFTINRPETRNSLTWEVRGALLETIAAAERHHDDPALLGPANVGTVAMHLLTGVLMTIGLVVAGPRG
mgnify:CR=1 FL=1